jgi:1-aminocyclopropane-1-carboxylate deaminase/D-cysteine desulfhydrase-like pyridoxal-dependent ACC family enzyme
VFGIRSSGPSSLSIDVTSDRKLLEVAIRNTAGNALRPSDILRITNGAVESNEVRYRATVALSAAYEMMTSLEQVHNRHKAFIYISNGYNFDLSPDGSTTTSGTSPFLRQSSDFGLARLRDQLSELTRRASHSIVTIFAIDPRGVASAPTMGPDCG